MATCIEPTIDRRRSDMRPPAALGSVLLTAWLVGACAGTSAPPEQTQPVAVATQSPTSRPTSRPTPTAPPALVGTWFGVHNCQTIVDLLTAADMPEQVELNIADGEVLPGVTDPADIADPKHPCVGAVEVRHSHFFTAGGLFGSRDANGQQVDDGTWSIVDATTFAIGDAEFHYAIEGDELHMEPVSVGSCPPNGEWCKEAWKLMVAMPGMAWTRG